jgi:hypothetical protein
MMIMGMLALATDLGWNHFVRKSAQTATDAGAMAAAIRALNIMGNSDAQCGTSGNKVGCAPDPIPCSSAAHNLTTGCLYAGQNGFTQGGKNGRQTVTIAAGAGTLPPTAPGVNDVYYWVTVRAAENVPRMFSGVFSTSQQGVVARSTAVVTNGILPGSLFLLNRQNDSSPAGQGVNADLGGNTTITAPAGIFMASTKNGAGKIQGNPTVTAPFTHIRGGGTVSSGGSATWNAPPQNGFPDGMVFQDPMGGKGQPPAVPAGGLAHHVGVLNGDLSTVPQPIASGQYYAVDNKGKATGGKLYVNNNVTFQDGGFGNYVLYGGLNVDANAMFYPGRYVIAGVKGNNALLEISNNGAMVDNSPSGSQNTDAGEIFVLTDASYPSLAPHVPAALNSVKGSLGFGSTELQAGNSQIVNLHGLNRDHGALPVDLKTFAPVAIWQDQRNSRIAYDSQGNVDISSCGGGHTIDNPCLNASMAYSVTPELKLQAHPNTSIYGVIYQPRGAWLDMQGNGSIVSSTVIITGSMILQGGCDVGSLDASDSLKRRVVALVE